MNAQILDLAKTHKEIIERKSYKDPGSELYPGPTLEHENHIFLGSTADLQRMMKDAKTLEMIDITPDDNS